MAAMIGRCFRTLRKNNIICAFSLPPKYHSLSQRASDITKDQYKVFFSSGTSHFSQKHDPDFSSKEDTALTTKPTTASTKAASPLINHLLRLEGKIVKYPCLEYSSKPRKKSSARKNISSIVEQSRPLILGFTPEELESRIEVLESAGITGQEALDIATKLPSHLNFNTPDFHKIVQLLKSLECNLPELVSKAPYVFGLNYKSLQENLDRLRGIGISDKVLGHAMMSNPVLVVYPLSDNAVKVLQTLLSACEFEEDATVFGSEHRCINKDEFVLRLLLQPIDGPREQAILGDNFQKVARFLRELQVSPCLMAINYPVFFTADVEKLNDALEFFTSRPLLFETELIQRLLVTRSDVFLNFDKKVFQDRVELLKGVLKTPRQLYMILQKYFFFKGGEINLEENIKILQGYGFENEHIAKILITKDFFASQENNLDEKIKFLLSLENIDVDTITNSSFCLSKPLEFLKYRVQYITDTKAELLDDISLGNVFGMDDEEFAVQLCQSTFEKYKRNAGPLIVSNLRKRTPRARTKGKQ